MSRNEVREIKLHYIALMQSGKTVEAEALNQKYPDLYLDELEWNQIKLSDYQ
jgi:hypothetical protein